MENTFITSVEKLTSFIANNKFEEVTQKTPYYHMGATITDSILQAGLNYQHVVYPRVLKLLTDYSYFKTTCDFIILFHAFPLSELITWKNEVKLERIKSLSWFFYKNKLENEDQLSNWLNSKENVADLFRIDGIGPKTIDYLKMLSGNQSIAVDRHLFKFLELANIYVRTYQEANALYQEAAKELKLTQYELDRKVWLFMTSMKI